MARSKAPARDTPRDLLQAAGLRCTTPRLAVLEHLQTTRGPLSHGELAEALAGREFYTTTIYRNLIDLESAGLVSRVNLGDNVWRFELAGPATAERRDHPHFMCVECGEISCLAQVQVQLTPAPGSLRSIVGSISDIVIKGQCKRCA